MDEGEGWSGVEGGRRGETEGTLTVQKRSDSSELENIEKERGREGE